MSKKFAYFPLRTNVFLLALCAGVAANASADTAAACAKWLGGEGPQSAWVYRDAHGRLAYKPFGQRGDRIIDFSHAGYMGGGVALPVMAVAETVGPAANSADDTATIQAAIDKVAQRPLKDGVRGAVLLLPGRYRIAGTLKIATSGVILRGSGAGAGGSVLVATGPGHNVLDIGGTGRVVTDAASATAIVDAYVPAGSNIVTVLDARKFKAGDDVIVSRPVTAKWIHAMTMDTLVRDGKAQTWLKAGRAQLWQRRIAAIDGNALTLDIALSDSLDRDVVNPPGATIVKYALPDHIVRAGVEGLAFEGAPRTGPLGTGIEYRAVTLGNAADSWADDIVARDMIIAVDVLAGAKRVTVRNVRAFHAHDTNAVSGAKSFDFSVGGSQVLFDRDASTGSHGTFYFSTQALSGGPNVLLNFRAEADALADAGRAVQPHQRWATGLLVDGAKVQGGIEYMNRLTAGTGHGWTMGWGVVWNSTADTLLIQAPPGVTNWSVGNVGKIVERAISKDYQPLPAGVIESANVHVTPHSLYLAQLCDRLGPAALGNIGY